MKNRAWKYCRQASSDEGLTGLQRQSYAIDRYTAQNDLSLVGETKVIEKGIGPDRKSLRELIRLAEDGAYDILLVSSLDRLARDVRSVMVVCRKLSELGIRIIAVTDNEEITEEDHWFHNAIAELAGA